MSVNRTVVVSKNVNAPLSVVLQALHDPMFLMKSGPLIGSPTVDRDDPDMYHIVHSLDVLGCIHTSTKFKAKFIREEDGVKVKVFANYGTTVISYWKARSAEQGSQLEVQSSATCPFFLAPYVLSTIRSDRLKALDKIASSLENDEPLFSYLALRHQQLVCALVLAGFVLVGRTMLSKDPYGLFHLSLNQLPGERESAPRTEWLNMGYWQNTTVFPEACEALALKLAHAAGCQQGGSVLDVGHGSGESLLLHLKHPSVPRPSRLTGITSLIVHHERSRDRVEQVLSEPGSLDTSVTLYHGDAVYRSSAVDHPLNPSSDSPAFTTILALDCAYHFDTRYAFLEQSFARLARGGRIALADLCFTHAALRRWSVALLAIAGVLPRANMISPEEYVRELQNIGFVDVSMEDVSEEVFPGFVRFLQSRGLLWWVFGAVVGWYARRGMRFVIATGRKG